MFAAEYERAYPGSRRRSPRASVSIEAKLGGSGFDRTLCKVLDISIHGVRLRSYSTVEVGSTLMLYLPGIGPKAVRVIRADDFEAGCEFVETLDMNDFKGLLRLGGAFTQAKVAE
jgi:hypothetical protein